MFFVYVFFTCLVCISVLFLYIYTKFKYIKTRLGLIYFLYTRININYWCDMNNFIFTFQYLNVITILLKYITIFYTLI